MVRTHLAAIERPRLAHLLLDEGMAGFRNDSLPAAFADDIDRVPGKPRVVDDGASGSGGEDMPGEKSN